MAAQPADNAENGGGNGGDDEDDRALFRRAMAGVNRNRRDYAGNRDHLRKTPPKPAVNLDKRRAAGPLPTTPAGGVLIDKTDYGDYGDYVEFARSGLQKKVMRRLKRGDHNCTATLDLHGRTIAEAEPLLDDFVRNATIANRSALLIIHGKGLHSGGTRGVLKLFTLNWLKQQAPVKAFCSALPRDGGTGAVYVLLRAGKR